MITRCEGLTRIGKPCKNAARPGSYYCPKHGLQKGGQMSSTEVTELSEVDLATLRDQVQALSNWINQEETIIRQARNKIDKAKLGIFLQSPSERPYTSQQTDTMKRNALVEEAKLNERTNLLNTKIAERNYYQDILKRNQRHMEDIKDKVDRIEDLQLRILAALDGIKKLLYQQVRAKSRL